MHESFNAALVDCVKACGGSAMVGAKLWPEKTPVAAQRVLLDCLSEDRPAKLSPEQVLFVLRLARTKGCHIGMEFLCGDLGYADPVPIDPKDELVDLLRQNIALRQELLRKSERIEQLMPHAGPIVRAVA